MRCQSLITIHGITAADGTESSPILSSFMQCERDEAIHRRHLDWHHIITIPGHGSVIYPLTDGDRRRFADQVAGAADWAV